MPRVAVWISFHACLVRGLGLCILPSHPKKQDKIQPMLQSTLRLSIHLSVERFCHKRKQENLRTDWEKMYAIHLKLESN